ADLAVNGLVEAMAHGRRIWYIYRRLRQALAERRPALVVLIDFPDFNMFFARRVNRLGIPLLWYVSPQVWAWRRYRLRKLARRVTRMMVVFPFEVPLYEGRGVAVDFVGHPLVDLARPRLPREETMRKLDLDPARPLVALLPGSRRSELTRIYPTLIEAAARMAETRPDIQFATPVASTLGMEAVAAYTKEGNVRVALGEDLAYDIMAAADAAAVAAGTATLECALVGVPMVMVYRLSAVTYLFRPVIDLEHFCLVNVVAGRPIVPELIQNDCTPERVAEQTLALLGPEGKKQREAFGEVRARLGAGGANVRAANVLLGMLDRAGEATAA
ncbi:MAG: lipid-A-disaccharide synthase, partial [Deltaproteobacteria bacterium]|nr:lipid-A-disaccharide synthase [Deltaproteobacteria bacterium]